jgi:GT2 family glycosyltransferase
MILVSIVTVNFREEQVTADFLTSIYGNNLSVELEVILVDNGSSMYNEEFFRRIYPELVYIQSEKNLGFAGGNNLGIQKASGKYILLLNNDTEITPECISSMVDEMEDNLEIGLISPLILYYEDKRRIQYAGFSKMNYLVGRTKTFGKSEVDHGKYDNLSIETGFCHGAAMMCRKIDLAEVGLMDENYFLYYEEMDWCEKFKKTGKKIWFTGKAKIYHKESLSVGKESNLKTYFLVRNRMLFIRKNTSSLNSLIFGIYYYSIACPALLFKYFISGKRNQMKWIWKGMLWNLKNSPNSTYLGFPITKD